MLVPHHLNHHSYLWKRYTSLSRVLVAIGNYKKHPLSRAFSGNLPETTPPIPPFPRIWEHAAPLCIRVGGGGGMSKTLLYIALNRRSLFRIIDFALHRVGQQCRHGHSEMTRKQTYKKLLLSDLSLGVTRPTLNNSSTASGRWTL